MIKIQPGQSEQAGLCELLDRVLNKGAVISGEAIISVAGVDLIYLGLQVILTSIETGKKVFRNDPPLWMDEVERSSEIASPMGEKR